jgi:hypothetical protein
MTTERSRHLATHPGSPTQRAILVRIRPPPVGHAVDAATAQPPPTTTGKSKPTPRWPSTACASLDRQVPTQTDDESVVDTAGDHADPGHPNHAAARPTAARHDLTPVGHRGRGSARTPDAPRWTPDSWTLRRPHRTLDSGRVDRHAWTLDARTGHWTPDAGRGRGHGDEARPASAPPGPPRPGAARWPPTVFLWTALRRLATMTARRWASL